MAFKPFEVTPVHLVYVGLGFFIVIFGILSLFIKEKLYLGEAPIAAVFGIIVGPAALNLFDPSDWGGNHTRSPGGHITNEITLEVMRVTIALSVFAVGVELPKKYVLRHWRSLIILLGPVMLWGWLVTAGFMTALIPGLDFLNSLVIAACVTPTDPILAQAVVGGPWAEKHVPAHIRHMLMCESGCNDGAAFPFLYLALYLTQHRDNTGKAIAEWFYDALAYQIIFGTILGALIGFCARKAIRFSERHHLVDRESFVAQYISLAIASMGVNVLLGSDDLLAAFACGTAFAWDGWFTRQTEDSNFSNIVDLLFNVATFIYIGALMPWYEFAHGAAGNINIWRLFVLAIAVLILRRFPVVLALWRWIPDIKTFREAIFSGHFAPMGVGAIFIATLGRDHLPEEVPDPPETTNDVLALSIQPVVFFLVLCSITVHGLTVPFFAFSKRATTLTRTWSRNPSFSEGGEPGWMNRMRRFKTGDTMASGTEVEGGGMTEIQRVLNAQLGVIGKGAIGGDAEKELRRNSSSGDDSSGPRTHVGLLNTRTERDLELAEGDAEDEKASRGATSFAVSSDGRSKNQDIDDVDDWRDDEAEDPSCEWGGDNTAEMKLYRAKRQARREAAKKRQQHEKEGKSRREAEGDDGDIGEAPMDRELIWGDIDEKDEDEDVRDEEAGRKARSAGAAVDDSHHGRDRAEKRELEEEYNHEKEYPKARSWLEGRNLVIEYSESRCSEPEVHVVELSKEEAAQIGETESEDASVAHAWLMSHIEELDHHVDGQAHRSWHPAETAKHLVTSGALSSWLSGGNNNKNSNKKSGSQSKSKSSAGHGSDDDETEQERRDRADMLYAAMNWRDGKYHDDEDDNSSNTKKAAATPRKESRPEALVSTSSELDSSAVSASSSSSSLDSSSSPSDAVGKLKGKRSPKLVQQQRRKASPNTVRRYSNTGRRASQSNGDGQTTGGAPMTLSATAPVSTSRQHLASGGRRTSMRRKILAGKIGFGSRDKKSQRRNDEYEDSGEEVEDTEGNPNLSVSTSSTPAQTPSGGEKFFPRTHSLGGMSARDQDVVGVLRTPEELDRERRANNRTPSASVSFLNTNDTKHDRVARGNTFNNGSSSSNSGENAEFSGDDSEQQQGIRGKSSSSSSSTSTSNRRGHGNRLSAFFNSLGSSNSSNSNNNAVPEETSNEGNNTESVIEALRLSQDPQSNALAPVASSSSSISSEPEAGHSDASEDPVAAMFFGSNKPKSNKKRSKKSSSSQSHSAAARPGPISRTFPPNDTMDGRGVSRESTPKEGILSNPSPSNSRPDTREGQDEVAEESGTVAFDLPSK
ncbi:unnamed protein product [Sympodiomycopsis kandeliae]